MSETRGRAEDPAEPAEHGPRLPNRGEALAGATRRLYFHGTGATLFSIQIVNVLLTLLTLGAYYFWGKVRALRYVLSQMELEGDRFVYHGTGRELLVGFLRALALFALPFVLISVVPNVYLARSIQVAAAVLGYGLLYLLMVPLAIVGARRYRLTRTAWRGIRFGFLGSAGALAAIFFRGSVLTFLTLGVYYPWFVVRRHAFLIEHSTFGSERFRFDGRGGDLFGAYVLLVLLTLPTLGLYWFWFAAWRQRYLWVHTGIAGARFRSSVTGGRLLRLKLGNLLLLIVTLGLGWPWARVRNLRFMFRYLALIGPLDLGHTRQSARAASASGEGFLGLLGSEFELGW